MMSLSAVLGLMLFSTFTNNTDNRNDCSLSKLVYDTKLSGSSDTPEGWNAIHRKLNKLKKRAHKNLISFNKIKSKVLYLGQGNPRQEHKLRAAVWRKTGVQIRHDLAMCTPSPQSQLCPGLHPKQCGQWGKGGDSPPLLC